MKEIPFILKHKIKSESGKHFDGLTLGRFVSKSLENSE